MLLSWRGLADNSELALQYVGYDHINASIMQAKMATTLSLVSPLAEAHINIIAQALSSSSALLDTCTLAQKAVGSSMINAWEQK